MMIKRIRAALILTILLAVAGCGIEPGPPEDAGHAPTGIAQGSPVYYVNGSGKLVVERVGRNLGTMGKALKLLLAGRHLPAGLHSYVGTSDVGLDFPVTRRSDVVTILMPIARSDVSRKAGIDQIVCTALAVDQQSGGSTSTTVRLRFTEGRGTKPRHCPALPTG